MFVELMNWLKDPGPEVDVPDDLRLAVAVLLVEAAHMDDKFGPHERAVIERLLLEKFELTNEEAQQLLSLSESTVDVPLSFTPTREPVSPNWTLTSDFMSSKCFGRSFMPTVY